MAVLFNKLPRDPAPFLFVALPKSMWFKIPCHHDNIQSAGQKKLDAWTLFPFKDTTWKLQLTLLVTSRWSELRHIATLSYKSGWEMFYYYTKRGVGNWGITISGFLCRWGSWYPEKYSLDHNSTIRKLIRKLTALLRKLRVTLYCSKTL